MNASVTAGSTASPVVGPTTNTTQVVAAPKVYTQAQMNTLIDGILGDHRTAFRALKREVVFLEAS